MNAINLPKRIEERSQLEQLIEEIGFLPLFKNRIDGFSVEDMTPSSFWFDGEDHDPWQWSRQIAQNRSIAYGKFFRQRAGFIAKQWLPFFINARRDGYDFDALYEDGKAPFAHKRIMDPFLKDAGLVLPSHILKVQTGYAEKGAVGFDSALMHLQMQTYLCICGFERKRNRQNMPYGWPVAELAMPETVFSEEWVKSRYSEDPSASLEAIISNAKRFLPDDSKTLRLYLS